MKKNKIKDTERKEENKIKSLFNFIMNKMLYEKRNYGESKLVNIDIA